MKPITFTGPMVQAIIFGTKTQTRRPKKINVTPGGSLWVRETWCTLDDYDHVPPRKLTVDKGLIWYLADGPKPENYGRTRAAMHLPERYSRIKLQVTDIRPNEKLDWISNYDCLAEGIEQLPNHNFKNYLDPNHPGYSQPFYSFKSLWASIYGVFDGDQEVTVYEFRKLPF